MYQYAFVHLRILVGSNDTIITNPNGNTNNHTYVMKLNNNMQQHATTSDNKQQQAAK